MVHAPINGSLTFNLEKSLFLNDQTPKLKSSNLFSNLKMDVFFRFIFRLVRLRRILVVFHCRNRFSLFHRVKGVKSHESILAFVISVFEYKFITLFSLCRYPSQSLNRLGYIHQNTHLDTLDNMRSQTWTFSCPITKHEIRTTLR